MTAEQRFRLGFVVNLPTTSATSQSEGGQREKEREGRFPVEKLWQKFIKNLNSVLIFSLTLSFVLKQSAAQGNAQN